ncbi:MAG: M3 family metallopeptidase [Gemmatimonadetes bacterium]|nr:M3 family metallopeptidase [Gemmatimonadota bacterium]
MTFRTGLAITAVLALSSSACTDSGSGGDNPFFMESPLLFNMPDFDRIQDNDFAPAFERGMAEQRSEIDVIANQTEAPTLENTLVALERSGRTLQRVSAVFFNLVAADTNESLEAIRSEMAPKLAAHSDQTFLNSSLFERIESVYEERDDLNLDPESLRLVERYHTDFVRAGAQLSDGDKDQLKALNAELAELGTVFSQNVLNEVNDVAVIVDSRDELAGLSDNAIAGAEQAAKERGLEGKYVIALLNTSGQPVLASLENRALRQRIHEISLSRGSRGGDFDNRGVLTRVVELRAQRAQLLGYPNHAAYILENETALSTDAVNQRLAALAPPAVANARREAADMQALIDAQGGGFQLAAWDWAYYTEKVRKARYDFDESQLRPYFEIDNVLQNGVFFAANKLYGLTFTERRDLPVYHPDVRIFEVYDKDGEMLAIFLGDFYARSSKRGGAWMNAYVSQSHLLGERPVVANHLNVPKPPEGQPTLMTFDEVTTMFHEFGHALHGMFSDVNYPYFAGTSVPRDFVEYPSQVNEMWAVWPEVLANYAVHHETGEAMPTALLDKVLATQAFNQGFATTEYLAASLLDQAWHQLGPGELPDADGLLAFEAKALEDAGVALSVVPPRYRSTYFSHIMGGYSAGYYSYIWSEVLDADTVEWFKENGGLKRENGDHFRATLLSRGGSVDAMTLFRTFRGGDPDIAPLLERRGLTGE